MLNKSLKLNPKIFDADVEQKPTRDGYGTGLVEAGKNDERVVVLCADLMESTRSDGFAKTYPDRFVEVGVAEQNLATIAAGMANCGKIPFISSYAMFSPGRNWEQIRTTICYNDVPAIIAGAHAGVSVGPDGATHQALEDIAIMRAIPRMTVINPCDSIEAHKATVAAAAIGGQVYLRFAREKSPIVTTHDSPFTVGRAEVAWDTNDGIDVAIVASGPLLYYALVAANELSNSGVRSRVINLHTIKPIDVDTLVRAARDAGRVVTVEEHQIHAGVGSAVAEVLAQNYPVPMEFVGVKNEFGQSGAPTELIEHYNLGTRGIIAAVQKVLAR